MAVPIKCYDDDTDGGDGHGTTPVVYYHVASGDFEGNHGGLEDEEVPASREAKCIIYITAGETDER